MKGTNNFIPTSDGIEVSCRDDYNQGSYILKHKDGVTCLGYGRVLKKALKYANYLQQQRYGEHARQIHAYDFPPVGTIEMYEHYVEIFKQLEVHTKNSGKRCEADLNKQLTPYVGGWVEVVDRDNDKRRFKIGISPGWLPIYLEVTGESDGEYATDDEYKSVRPVKSKNSKD